MTQPRRQDEIELYAALRQAAVDYRDAGFKLTDGRQGDGGWGGRVVVWDVLCRLGISERRGFYLLKKWSAKGWIEYGMWVEGGWFTAEAPLELSR